MDKPKIVNYVCVFINHLSFDDNLNRFLLISDSPNWVLFQPNIVIDAKLGCLWFVKLRLDSLMNLITDRVRLVELLLHRTNAKNVLIDVLNEMLITQYNGNLLTVIENVFDKLNVVYS